MSLDHILLGMLRRPASGYDLKQEFEQGVRHFWSAELSQIYPTLTRLERQGLLKSSREPSAQGPERRVYRRTDKGRKELLQWLRGGPVMGKQRFAYVAQLAFLHEAGDPQATREFMERLRVELRAYLDFLEVTEKDALAASPHPESWPEAEFHEYLCLRMGVTSIRARIVWCEECLTRIRARQRKVKKKGAAK